MNWTGVAISHIDCISTFIKNVLLCTLLCINDSFKKFGNEQFNIVGFGESFFSIESVGLPIDNMSEEPCLGHGITQVSHL